MVRLMLQLLSCVGQCVKSALLSQFPSLKGYTCTRFEGLRQLERAQNAKIRKKHFITQSILSMSGLSCCGGRWTSTTCFYKRNKIVRDWLRWCSFARRVGELSPRSARIFCRRSKDVGPEALCERESAYLRIPL